MPSTKIPLQESLPPALAKVFDQAQSSIANHQKNYITLYKLHASAADYTEPDSDSDGLRLSGERMFEVVFLDMINRVLLVKKSVSVADRIVKFTAGYLKTLDEKTTELVKSQGRDEDEETTAIRFTARLIKYFLAGFVAKDKIVRYRSVNFVEEMVLHLGELTEELYVRLRAGLMERVYDKEPTIRVLAVKALAKISGSEDPLDVAEGEPTVFETLTEILKYDTSADIRRAALVEIPVTPASLPHILTRTRDVDSTVRKLVYSDVLEPNCCIKGTESKAAGFTHPRALTIATREMIVKHGLGDREPAVRSAAASLVVTWVEVIRSLDPGVKDEGGVQDIERDIVAFLKMFDLAEKTAEDALICVFKTRVEMFENIEFGDAFWDNLDPERAFFARVFVDHCIEIKDDTRLESALPVVTSLAFKIQERYNELMTAMQEEEEERILLLEERGEDRARKEEERIDWEYVIAEMLKLAVNLDYADEIGRRKMFQLVRDMISQEALPESLVARCLDVLRKLSDSERDLIRVVVEVVHELRDPNEPEEELLKESGGDEGDTTFSETPPANRVRPSTKSYHDLTPEQKAKSDAMDLRCLSLCIGMLERVNGTFEENSTLQGIMEELILPAVRNKDIVLREKGLTALGLVCLIARNMALSSIQLFLNQIQLAPEQLKLRLLHVVFDMLMVHEADFLAKGSIQADQITDFLVLLLDREESQQIQGCLCVGLAKLVLSGLIDNEQALKSLIFLYVSPDTADNQQIRQCLSYFFPVFCYSSPGNQRRMQKLFIPVYEQLCEEFKDLDDGQDMVNPLQVGSMFVDWTDPVKAVPNNDRPKDESIHVDLASDIVKHLFNSNLDKDDKKSLCQLLARLNFPESVDDDKIKTLKLLVYNLQSRRPLKDTTAKNAFARFDALISKKYEKQLEDFREDEYRKLEYLKEMFEFLDDIIPEEEEIVLPPASVKGRKRRSLSVATTTSATSANESDSNISKASSTRPSRGRAKGKGKATKRPRLSYEDDEDSEDGDRTTIPPSVAPTRSMPSRAAAQKGKQKAIIEISSDDSEDDVDGTPVPRRKASRYPGNGSKTKREEDQLDAEIDDLLDGGVSTRQDDGEDEDEEEEEISGMLDEDVEEDAV